MLPGKSHQSDSNDRFQIRKPSCGMTLSELLVAMVIVSFMMIVIFGLDFSVRSLDKTASTGGNLYVQTLAVAEHFRKNAGKATGDFSDPGVRFLAPATPGNNNYVCFRQDLNNPPSSADYSNDTWVCFSFLGSQFEDIHRCQPNIPGPCLTTDTFIGKAVYSRFSPNYTNGVFTATVASPVVTDIPQVIIPIQVSSESHSYN